MSIKLTPLAALFAGLLLSCAATAQTTYTDNFSGATSSLSWLALNDACLTAGTLDRSAGVIPGCAKIGTTAPSDAAGFGALRLTAAQNNRTGAILSNFTFPLSQGMQVTFTTYTYGGDKGGTAKNGADGISFILTDGTATTPTVAGGLGGSLGYSCSNINNTYEGMANAYLGLGIDEYGNYLNNGDNTNTGIATDYSVNLWGSGNYQPQRIGLRGAGNTTWAWLKAQNSTYYSGAAANKTKVTDACRLGKYVSNGNTAGQNLVSIPYNYNAVAGGYKVLPITTLIANEVTQTRAGNPSAPADYTKNAWPITYKLTLSPGGLLNFSYSYNNGAFQPVLANNQITTVNGPLPASFRFGFSSGTGGSNNVHEITCFQATPLQSNSSASANTVQSGQVKIGSQIYLASYSTDNWFGSLVSDSLVTTGSTLSIATVANWDAKCALTGGLCPAMGTDAQGNATTTITAQTPASRTLLTWNDVGLGAALPLQWASLTAVQKTFLNSTDGAGADRVKWLRGDRSVEQLASPTPGNLRARAAVLGDIINSSPTWVGAPVTGANPDVFTDALYGSGVTPPENNSGAQTYSAFASTNATRLNVVYVGGNDGFLHGFRAGAYDGSGNYTATNSSNTYTGTVNDGQEVLGFMPSAVLSSAALVSLTNPTYVHSYFVDATPTAADLFYNNAWHTWLVGGVGTGGKEIYALDITTPGSFAESNASAIVIGDWTSASPGLLHLGQTVGTPIITRMHNGQWAIIFGNGLGSGTSAGIYIGLVDSTTGKVTFQFLDTGVGDLTPANANGIAYVVASDLDGDHIADHLYASDLKGNVWRFDVTSSNASSWIVSKFGSTTAKPLFVAKDGTGTLQPITTAPVIAAVRTGSVNRVMVMFGTGQKTPLTATNPELYAAGQQTFYGIWDWDMSAWNAVANSQRQYASLSGTQAIARSALLAQTVVSTAAGPGGASRVLGYRNLSTTNVVCWKGSSTCASSNSQYGWLFDLPAAKEQIIYNPAIIGGAVVVSTAIPPVISALQCNAGFQSGWTMAFDPSSGGALPSGFFPNGSGAYGNNADGSASAGIRLDAVGSPTAVTYSGQTYIVTQTVSGSAALSPVNPPSNNVPSRISWREIRN